MPAPSGKAGVTERLGPSDSSSMTKAFSNSAGSGLESMLPSTAASFFFDAKPLAGDSPLIDVDRRTADVGLPVDIGEAEAKAFWRACSSAILASTAFLRRLEC